MERMGRWKTRMDREAKKNRNKVFRFTLTKEVCADCGREVYKIDGETCEECERFLCNDCGAWSIGLPEGERQALCDYCSEDEESVEN